MQKQGGGGSQGQSLQYVDPTVSERSGPAGSDVLVQDGLIVRPEIGVIRGGRRSKGGFVPSVMGGVVGAGTYLGPLAALTAKRMLSRSKKGGGKENWAARRSEAKEIFEKFCKPSATDVNQMAAALRKGSDDALAALQKYEGQIMQKAHMEATKLIDKVQKKIVRESKRKTKKAPSSLVFNSTKRVVRKNLPYQSLKSRSQNDRNIWATLLYNAERKLQNTLLTRKKRNKVITKQSVQNLAKLLQSGKSTKKFLSNFGRTLPIVSQKPIQTKKVRVMSKPEIIFNNTTMPLSSTVKTKKKTFTQAHRNAYTQAKSNLASIKAKPHSSKIMKLVSLRKEGNQKKINNFLKTYRSVQ